MRDSKDHATLELPGMMPAAPEVAHLKRAIASRTKKIALQQVQLELLEPGNLPGSPIWQRDQNTVPAGLPI